MFFRAFFALPPLTNDSGMPTNALYGFLSMTIKLLREIKPDYLAFCFDTKEPSFRNEIYKDYKANREEMPENLVPQIPYITRLTEALGITKIEQPGFEADDLIGTLVKLGREKGLEIVIVSGDKDFAQLVAPHVSMYDTMKDVRYDTEGVLAKWGVRPDQIVDYLSLVGDSSDNIPGVYGIGPKGAQKLLSEFKTLDGIYKNLDQISGKAMRAKLEEHRDDAYLSQKLAAIHCDIKLKCSVEDLKLKEINRGELRGLLQELSFKTFEKNLFGDGRTDGPTEKIKKEKVEIREKRPVRAPQKSSSIKEVHLNASDLDTIVKPYSDVWALLTERGLYLGYGDQLLLVADDARTIGKILGKKQLNWLGYDLKEVWRYLEMREAKAAWDQTVAAYNVRAGNVGPFAETYKAYIGQPLPDLLSPAEYYACQLQLREVLERELDRVHGRSVFETIDLPLVEVLSHIESHGVLIDLDELKTQSSELRLELHDCEKEIHSLAGEIFNIASPKQLAQILFGKLKLNPVRKTKTGYSTDSDVLEKLASEHPIAELIINYRELAKLQSTYLDALPHLVNPKTGRVHTHLNQTATSTGRLSSQNPNLQNIPIRTERGRRVRRAFVAPKGGRLISADYSQIELRILAHIAQDSGLISAFENDLDIHAATASEIFSVPLKDVTEDLRRAAKAVNFGIAYGQGVFGLSESLSISREEAADIIGRYFNRFSGVKEYMDHTVKQAYDRGYVETLFGRRRYVDELKSKNGNIKKFGERAAINAPIQGTAADIVKMAMIQMHQEVSIPMVLQVHDELLFECPEDKVEKSMPRIKKVMEHVHKLKVPLKVNCHSGKNWDDAH